MNMQELAKLLRDERFNPQTYSLDGGLPFERYCLCGSGGAWQVYYSERGEKTGLRTFDSEAAACDYFLKWIREDPVTRA